MRKAVLGSIAAVTAGAGLASAQGFPSAPPASAVMPAAGFGGPPADFIPPNFGGGGDPGVMPVGPPAPNGAPGYPPPGTYGKPGFDASANSRGIAPNWWLRSEYLLWFVRAQPTRAPYVTTGAPADGGLLGRPSTSVLSGSGDLGYDTNSGFRISGGWFKGDDRRMGFEFSGFLLGQKGNFFFGQSDPNGVPVISRPFTDASAGNTPGVLVVSFPNLASGSVLVSSTTQTYGGEANALVNLFRSCPDDACVMSVNALVGFRYMEINETLGISSSSTLLGASTSTFGGLLVNAPATIGVRDMFETTNRFYGGQIGFQSELRYSRLTLTLAGKVAAGNMNQTLDVSGTTDINDPTRGLVATNPGGLYASPQAVGRRRNDEFVVIPEITGSIGYNWSSWLTTFVGYNALYANRVIRPGSQFSTSINPGVLPASPTFGQGSAVAIPNAAFTQEEFWLQGVTFGLVVKY